MNHAGRIIFHLGPGWGGKVQRQVPTTSVSVGPSIGQGIYESDTCRLCTCGKPETMAIQNWYAISTQYMKMKQKRKMKEVRMPWTQIKKKAPPPQSDGVHSPQEDSDSWEDVSDTDDGTISL